MQKKFLWLITIVLLAGFMTMGTLAADEALYNIVGTSSDSGTFTVEVYMSGVNAVCGSLSLDYDETKLDLIMGSSFESTVKESAGATVTSEGWETDELISANDGTVQFAWYPKGSRLMGKDAEQLVATIRFKLKSGVTTADFNGDTVRMKYMDPENKYRNSGAWIRGEGLVDYKNNTDLAKQCQVNFSYPGSGKTPAGAEAVEVTLCDMAGLPLKNAQISIGNRIYTADSSGKVSAQLTKGAYRFKAESAGYAALFGTLDTDKQAQRLELQSNLELVQTVANELQIGYATGDSAQSVTQSIRLDRVGENNVSISWKSSNQSVVSDSGSVFPAGGDTKVTLTATISKDQHVLTKTFAITVGAVQKPPINPEENPSGGGTVTPEEKSFTDLWSTPWAKDAILALTEKGIIFGRNDKIFAPKDNITRGDFVALLIRMIAPNGEISGNFADVPTGSYYYKEIAIAKHLGIVSGTGGNLFNPKVSISRQDMFSMAYRGLSVLKQMKPSEGQSALAGFKDSESIASYAKSPISALAEAGIVSGDNGKNLRPTANSTRAETAVFLHNILLKLM